MNDFWTIMVTLSVLFLFYNAWGLYIRDKGQLPLDENKLKGSGAKIVRNNDGRAIEYRCYGSTSEDAPVVVNIHGSGLESGYEEALYKEACEALGLRGIAISLPGCGYSDIDIGRRVIDWPKHDLLPVLVQEKVEQFYITGHSQGTPHAMAAAYMYPQRCLGMGLNAPVLPTYLSRRHGIPEALGSGGLLKTSQLQSFWTGWYFATIKITLELLSPTIPVYGIIRVSPKFRMAHDQLSRLKASLKRTVVRNSVGNTWESTQDVCYEWGFDPLAIEVNNIAIWHAADDGLCPPEIGEWLAQQFLRKEQRTVDFKNTEVGLGHFTFCGGIYKEPEGSMLKVLVEHSSTGEIRLSA